MAWFLAVLSIAAGIVLFVVGHLTADDKLPRNHFAGARTAATLKSDEAWYAGQRAAAIPTQAAGAIAILGGVILAVWHPDTATAGTVGLALGALIVGAVIFGGVRANTAAVAASEPTG
jgi:hypothetical protein